MIRWYAALRVEAQTVVQMTTVAVLGSSLIGLGAWAAMTKMDERAAEQYVCAAKIEQWKKRNPTLAKGLHMQRYDACVDLRALLGDEP